MEINELKLTLKQEKFCNLYIELGDASKAYRGSYSCDKMKPESVNRKAVELLSDGKITARVKELQNELKSKSDISKERILEELSKIGFSSIAHLHNSWIERVDFETLTAEQKSSIKSISTKVLKKNVGTQDEPDIIDVEYVKIELYDKLKALESISKMLGYDAPIKQEVSFNMPLKIEVVNEATKQELEKLQVRLKE